MEVPTIECARRSPLASTVQTLYDGGSKVEMNEAVASKRDSSRSLLLGDMFVRKGATTIPDGFDPLLGENLPVVQSIRF